MDGVKRMAWTFGLVAVWSLLGALAMYQWDIFSMGETEWKSVIVGVIAGVGAFATNYLMPFIKQYGVGSEPKV